MAPISGSTFCVFGSTSAFVAPPLSRVGIPLPIDKRRGQEHWSGAFWTHKCMLAVAPTSGFAFHRARPYGRDPAPLGLGPRAIRVARPEFEAGIFRLRPCSAGGRRCPQACCLPCELPRPAAFCSGIHRHASTRYLSNKLLSLWEIRFVPSKWSGHRFRAYGHALASLLDRASPQTHADRCSARPRGQRSAVVRL